VKEKGMNLAPILITLGGGLLALVLAIYFWVSAGRGGRRTQAVFFTILAAVLLIVAAGLGWQRLGPNAQQQPLVATQRGPVQVRVLAALPIEPWVREAARQFNEKGLRQDGQPVEIQVTAIDGLTALGKFDRDEFGTLPQDKTREQLTAQERQKLETSFPTVWIPDSRYLVELANAAYKERLGRDVFLTDGEYRAKPTAISLFAWGLYNTRAAALEKKFGKIDWQAIHDAAIAKGGWPELGGDPAWGFFKLVVPNPRRNVGGLAAMIAAAGEYYDKPNISEMAKGAHGLVDRCQRRQRLHRRGFRAVRLFGRRWRPTAGKRLAQQHGRHPEALVRSAGDPLPEVRHLVRLPLLDLGGAGDHGCG
jgi:hypothetical protein